MPQFCFSRGIGVKPSSSGPPDPADPTPLKRGRKALPKILPEQIIGRSCVRALAGFLDRLRAAYPHPNRVLFFDDVLVAYLLAFFNPVVRSLRSIEDMSQLPGINRFLGVDAVCRSTLSDANQLFDPELLRPLLDDLRAKLPNLHQMEGGAELQQILDQLKLVDGSHFNVAADVQWAMQGANQHSAGRRSVRLNCQFCLRTGVPDGISLNGQDGIGEGSAATGFIEPGTICLFDSGVVSFPYIQAILDKQAHLLCNLATSVKFTAEHERELSEEDRRAGVISDHAGKLTGSDRRTAPSATLREVVVQITDRDGKLRTLRLLTDLLHLPARLIAELYRHRWQVEIFFRWLKVHANFEHLTSHSRNGITLGFYVAVIATMLMCLQTQRQLSLYGYNLLAMVAMGLGDVDDILPLLENREREKQRDRDRRARKKAAKKRG